MAMVLCYKDYVKGTLRINRLEVTGYPIKPIRLSGCVYLCKNYPK